MSNNTAMWAFLRNTTSRNANYFLLQYDTYLVMMWGSINKGKMVSVKNLSSVEVAAAAFAKKASDKRSGDYVDAPIEDALLYQEKLIRASLPQNVYDAMIDMIDGQDPTTKVVIDGLPEGFLYQALLEQVT